MLIVTFLILYWIKLCSFVCSLAHCCSAVACFYMPAHRSSPGELTTGLYDCIDRQFSCFFFKFIRWSLSSLSGSGLNVETLDLAVLQTFPLTSHVTMVTDERVHLIGGLILVEVLMMIIERDWSWLIVGYVNPLNQSYRFIHWQFITDVDRKIPFICICICICFIVSAVSS